MTSESNKRIAKNTLMLYIRMLLTMVVALYTSRVVLSTLGVEDFGIYNVVGGFVTMVGFLNHGMTSATQRFLSFEIGTADPTRLKHTFFMSVNIHVILAVIILLITETVGLWVVNTQLTIPPERMNAANWVYQFSILTFLITVVTVPYHAVIIAHERMSIFAWLSIVEVFLKLLIVFMLQWFGFDKLKFYAVLMFAVTLIIRSLYGNYSVRSFFECRYRFYWNKSLFKTMMSYGGWSLWGNGAYAMSDQGVNMVLNMFFGPVVNAARGVAYQIKGAVYGFVLNFQVAVNPQIVKSYASNNLSYMYKLIYQSSKFSFFLLYIISLPLLYETEYILSLWLKEVPEYTVLFVRLVIVNILIESLSGSLIGAAQATGRVRVYHAAVGSVTISILPISYLFLHFGKGPEVAFYVIIAGSIIGLFLRLFILSSLIQLDIKGYFFSVLLRVGGVAILAIALSSALIMRLEVSFIRLLLSVLICTMSTFGAIYLIGLNKDDKGFLREMFNKFFKRKIKKQKW